MATADSLPEPKEISRQCATNCHQKRCNSTIKINVFLNTAISLSKGTPWIPIDFYSNMKHLLLTTLAKILLQEEFARRDSSRRFFCKNGLHGNFIGYTVCVKFYLKKQKQMQILTRLLKWAIRVYSFSSYHLIQSRQMNTDIYISYHFTK